MTVPLATSLAQLCRENRAPDAEPGAMEKAYRNTVYCCSSLEQSGGTIAGKYCGNRMCLVCNRIRTGRAITNYKPIVDSWADRRLVTLTIRNVPAAELAPALKDMIRTFQICKLGIRRSATVIATKHASWVDGAAVGDVIAPMKLVALRKLECTYNRARDDYHPHFHILCQTPAMAYALRQRWLDYYRSSAEPIAQDSRPVDGAGVLEVFKYFTKLIAKTKTARGELRAAPVDPRALHVIFSAMRGQRVYQPIGFKLPPAAAPDADGEIEPVQGTPALSRIGENILWEWSQRASDWIDARTGDCLTGYEPAARFEQFVQSLAVVDVSTTGPPIRGPTADEKSEYRDAAPRRVRALLLAYSRERLEQDRAERLERAWTYGGSR